MGNAGSDTIYRLSEGIERFMIGREQPEQHAVLGARVGDVRHPVLGEVL